MEELLDGSWVATTSNLMGYDDVSHIDTYGRLQYSWSPNRCRLRVFHPSVLQEVFAGKHLWFAGDSTMHEMLRLIVLVFGFDIVLDKGPCVHPDRMYDSLDQFPVRFSFDWDASVDICTGDEGIASMLTEEGKARFLPSAPPDVDFAMAYSGAHELVGGIRMEDYKDHINPFLQMILEAMPKVKQDPRRLVWRTTSPFGHAGNLCTVS